MELPAPYWKCITRASFWHKAAGLGTKTGEGYNGKSKEGGKHNEEGNRRRSGGGRAGMGRPGTKRSHQSEGVMKVAGALCSDGQPEVFPYYINSPHWSRQWSVGRRGRKGLDG